MRRKPFSLFTSRSTMPSGSYPYPTASYVPYPTATPYVGGLCNDYDNDDKGLPPGSNDRDTSGCN